MIITGYTDAAAQNLNRLHIPEITTPIRAGILWLEHIVSSDVSIYKGEHSHSFFEIHFVFSGEVSYKIGDGSITLHEGEALLIPPDCVHRFLSCSGDIFKNALAFTLEDSEILHQREALRQPSPFAFPESIAQDVSFLLQQSICQDCFTPVLISGRILGILYTVFGILGIRFPEIGERVGDSRLFTAQQFIENNRHRLITCEDAARACCLSRKQLNRIFKKYTGRTLQETITDVRAEYARQLILHTEYSIKEISARMGFENVSGFVSFFKRCFCMPPQSYRLNHQHQNKYIPPKLNAENAEP